MPEWTGPPRRLHPSRALVDVHSRDNARSGPDHAASGPAPSRTLSPPQMVHLPGGGTYLLGTGRQRQIIWPCRCGQGRSPATRVNQPANQLTRCNAGRGGVYVSGCGCLPRELRQGAEDGRDERFQPRALGLRVEAAQRLALRGQGLSWFSWLIDPRGG